MTLWARGHGLTLTEVSGPPDDEAVEAAMRDAVARGYDGALPPWPPGLTWLLVRRGGEPVGVLAFAADHPTRGDVTVSVIAVAAEARGCGTGTWALQLVERRLRATGALAEAGRLFALVSQTNGRGFYFMLRAGFQPLTGASVPPGSLAGLGTAPSTLTGTVPSTWFVRAEVA